MNKFFVDSKDILDRDIIISNIDDIKHITKTLRLKAGKEILISDGSLWEYLAEIKEISKDSIRCQIIDKNKGSEGNKIEISLFQGIPKGSKMEYVVQKNVELGVSEIFPVFMDRTIVKEGKNFSSKILRWQRIAFEAAKQCKRNALPVINEAISFDEMLELFRDFDLVIFPYENQEERNIKDLFLQLEEKDKKFRENIRKVAIVIGPEGGFSVLEAERIVSFKGESVKLGPTILRTETAGLVANAMTIYALEL